MFRVNVILGQQMKKPYFKIFLYEIIFYCCCVLLFLWNYITTLQLFSIYFRVLVINSEFQLVNLRVGSNWLCARSIHSTGPYIYTEYSYVCGIYTYIYICIIVYHMLYMVCTQYTAVLADVKRVRSGARAKKLYGFEKKQYSGRLSTHEKYVYTRYQFLLPFASLTSR